MHCRILSRKQGKASSPTSPIMSQPNPFFRPPVFLSDVTDINCKIHFDLHSCFLCVMWGSVDCWAQPNYFRAAFSRYNQVAISRNILYIPLSTAKHSIATEASIGVLLYSVFSILVEYRFTAATYRVTVSTSTEAKNHSNYALPPSRFVTTDDVNCFSGPPSAKLIFLWNERLLKSETDCELEISILLYWEFSTKHWALHDRLVYSCVIGWIIHL